MKNFKKLLVSIFAILSVCALCLIPKSSKAESSAEVLGSGAFSYISLSQAGQVIDSSKLTTIDDSTYVITNNSVTITLKPLQYRYRITADSNNFFKYTKSITLERDAETSQFPASFEFDGRTYYYAINNTTISIYTSQLTTTSSPIVTSGTSDLISFEETDNVRTIHITTAYTSTSEGFVDEEGAESVSCLFRFSIGTSSYSLNIQKPIVNFFNLTEPIVMFNTFKTDDHGDAYPAEKSLAPDQIFNKLQISFLNNDYTEGNPLYFKINYNGFVYDYSLYSQDINGENLLFVNYSNEDTNYNYNNSAFLASATSLDENGNIFAIENQKVFAKTESDDHNQFSLTFNKTGRYDIEIYDSTYLQNMSNPNYYSTSFFIREEGEEIKPFENVYIVAETLDDNNEHIEYIVSNSVLNNITKITVKNLGDFGKDSSGKDLTLADVIENIQVLTTDFGIDRVDTVTKTYTVDDILNSLENNDFVLNFTNDAYYQIIINPKDENLNKLHYIFTIVRNAKTTFTFNDEVYEATTLYHTDIRYYTNPIKSEIDLIVKFTTTEENAINLKKTYVNTFIIKYGVKAVKVEKYTPSTKDDEKVPVGLYLKVYGVGDITVYLTINGKEQEPITLNSENGNNAIDLVGYGTYSIRIVDSMGTESQTMTYSVKKGLNTSALVLIGLSALLATIIIVFILKARGKVATR